MVDRKEDQSTQFRDTSAGNFEQATKTVTQSKLIRRSPMRKP